MERCEHDVHPRACHLCVTRAEGRSPKRSPRRSGPTKFRAKYRGTCHECGFTIEVDELVQYAGRHLIHADHDYEESRR